MSKAAAVLDAEREKLAELAVREMGKPIRAARGEVDKCAAACRYYAERAKQYLGDERIEVEGKEAFLRYLPIGPVLAVMPWNFPYWQVFRFIAPTLMAGNVGLLKHASSVPKCALAIESVRSAGGDCLLRSCTQRSLAVVECLAVRRPAGHVVVLPERCVHDGGAADGEEPDEHALDDLLRARVHLAAPEAARDEGLRGDHDGDHDPDGQEHHGVSLARAVDAPALPLSGRAQDGVAFAVEATPAGPAVAEHDAELRVQASGFALRSPA